MKTIVAVALAVMGTALLLPRQTGQAASYTSPVGRYRVEHTNFRSAWNVAWMLDTQTGAVWQWAAEHFCQLKEPPASIRLIAPGESCTEAEEDIPIQGFERVGVQGLYVNPVQKAYEGVALGKFLVRPAKPKQ